MTSVVLSSGVALTVKLLIDQLAFRMSAMRQCSLRQKWANPTYPHTNKQIRLRDLAEADTSPSLSARRRKDSDKLNNYIRSTLALKTYLPIQFNYDIAHPHDKVLGGFL